jgi:hypothetical protein
MTVLRPAYFGVVVVAAVESLLFFDLARFVFFVFLVFVALAGLSTFACAAAPVGSEGVTGMAWPPGDAGTAGAAPGTFAASPLAGWEGAADAGGVALVSPFVAGVPWAPAMPAVAANASATAVFNNVFMYVLDG